MADPVVIIDDPDALITISVGDPDETDANEPAHFDNLVDKINNSALMTMASDLLRGIKIDEMSRSEWLEMRAKGLALLGLRIKPPKSDGGDLAAPVEGISTYDDPLLLEAVIRGQANAFAELCPTDGPVKIRNDDLDPTGQFDYLADALERELNHFLTVTATEWLPETDRGLFLTYFGGMTFKKIYRCPLRNRPVSEGVDALDLIVSNDVTDLNNASRVTHRIRMDQATFRRMQNLGVYKDTYLVDPQVANPNSVEQAAMEISGLKIDASLEQKDRERQLYECYCKYDIPGFEGKGPLLDGVPLPWRVTIDEVSEEVISVVRNWDEDDELCMPKEVFVDFPYIRGFGFYALGLLHILGNTTNGLSAATREMIDAGMFASFPGLLHAIDGPEARQKTNIVRVPPGCSKGIQTNGKPIGQVVMGMPYHDASSGLIAVTESVRENGQRLGGTADIEVGESRQDAPVGTTLALIEQSAIPQSAVHKRLYQSQAREIRLLVEQFRQDPEALWRHNRKPATQWTKEIVLAALDNYDLVPAADPNTSSHVQRLGRAQALAGLAMQVPGIFNPYEVAKKIILDARLGNPNVLLNDPSMMQGQQQQNPQLIDAQSRQMMAQAKMAQVQNAHKDRLSEAEEADKDRQAKIQIARLQEIAKQAREGQQASANMQQQRQQNMFEAMQSAADRQHQMQQGVLDKYHEIRQRAADRQHQAQQSAQQMMAQGQQQREQQAFQAAQKQQEGLGPAP